MRFIISLLIMLLSLSIADTYADNTLTNQPELNDGPVKIACVGDSITYGYEIPERKKNSYPGQLQALLGENYLVKNFGHCGRTYANYRQVKKYQKALLFKPNYVIIKFGSNDARMDNVKNLPRFEADVEALVKSFEQLPTKPKVFLSLPAPVVTEHLKTKMPWGISEQRVSEVIIPRIKKLAEKLKLPVIDFHSAIPAKKDLIPDGVHPSKEGSSYMAAAVYELLTGNKPVMNKR